MKKKFIFNNSILLLSLIGILMVTCKSKNDPSPSGSTGSESSKLVGNWVMQNVLVDGVDKTSTYSGMTLSFTATSFTSTKADPVWPSSGTWSLNSNGTTFNRDDGVEVSIQAATTSSLKLGLSWSTKTYGPGKINSVAGNHVFTFTK